uniref:Secreted protein n=1 Tax=Ascaris lumbricoides TaxID=6252 RepID=A0A0M3HFB3_ASCLU
MKLFGSFFSRLCSILLLENMRQKSGRTLFITKQFSFQRNPMQITSGNYENTTHGTATQVRDEDLSCLFWFACEETD